MQVNSQIESFLHYLETEKRYSSHTLLAYKIDLDHFQDFAEIKSENDWKEVNFQLIRAWMVSLIESGLTNKSVNRKLSSLRSLFRFFKSVNFVNENPMLKVKGPKIEKRLPNFVKEEELQESKWQFTFPKTIDGLRDQLLLELLYQTGIRLSELIELKEVNIQASFIKVLGKRNKERVIPIGEGLFQKIQEYRNCKLKEKDAIEYLLVKKNGEKLSPKFVYRKINTYLGFVTSVQKKSPHVLRHTFATHLLNNGAGLETLKELLGHANLSATQVYTHNSFAQINAIYSSAHPRGHKK